MNEGLKKPILLWTGGAAAFLFLGVDNAMADSGSVENLLDETLAKTRSTFELWGQDFSDSTARFKQELESFSVFHRDITQLDEALLNRDGAYEQLIERIEEVHTQAVLAERAFSLVYDPRDQTHQALLQEVKAAREYFNELHSRLSTEKENIRALLIQKEAGLQADDAREAEIQNTIHGESEGAKEDRERATHMINWSREEKQLAIQTFFKELLEPLSGTVPRDHFVAVSQASQSYLLLTDATFATQEAQVLLSPQVSQPLFNPGAFDTKEGAAEALRPEAAAMFRKLYEDMGESMRLTDASELEGDTFSNNTVPGRSLTSYHQEGLAVDFTPPDPVRFRDTPGPEEVDFVRKTLTFVLNNPDVGVYFELPQAYESVIREAYLQAGGSPEKVESFIRDTHQRFKQTTGNHIHLQYEGDHLTDEEILALRGPRRFQIS